MDQGKGARFPPAMAPIFSLGWSRPVPRVLPRRILASIASFALRLCPHVATMVLVEYRASVVSACHRCLEGGRAPVVPGRG